MRPEPKNYCAGEGQQQFNLLTDQSTTISSTDSNHSITIHHLVTISSYLYCGYYDLAVKHR
jgi:hypothetical protein